MRIRQAFTLIELLVVISVIAVLMGILMPALMAAKDHGKRMVCASNIRSLGMANVLYAEEEDGWYVACMDRVWRTNYWPTNKLFRTLAGHKSKQSAEEMKEDGDYAGPREFLCPSDIVSLKKEEDSQYKVYLSYGYNVSDWYYGDAWYDFKYAGHKTTTVPRPAGEMIFSESNDWWMYWKGANYTAGWDVLGQDTITPYKKVGCDGPTLYRHSNGVNLAFYDGHMEYRKKTDVWNQDAWDAGSPDIWSIFSHWPPTPEEQSRLPRPAGGPSGRP